MSAAVDIVIVGAGAAGIAAARRLTSSSASVLLLEAGSRIGGRGETRELAGLPLDLGCGWLHSADRNVWVEIARESGIELDRRQAAWGRQFRELHFTRSQEQAARQALDSWAQRLSVSPPPTDCAADALQAGEEWNAFVRAIAAFLSGASLEQLSAADYAAYDQASTEFDWRSPTGFGSLIAASLPPQAALSLSTPVKSLRLRPGGVRVETPRGGLDARAVILTVSTAVLAGDSIELPRELSAWRDAARRLPLGHTEKYFFEIRGEGLFEPETQVIGDPRDPHTAAYYLRPFGWPVIECFFSGEGAQVAITEGQVAAFDFALGQLTRLFGADIRQLLRPLAASQWSRMERIGGAYSYALPGQAAARHELAQPCEDRVFFAGEATSRDDYSTAHGAYGSGVRAAEQSLAALAR